MEPEDKIMKPQRTVFRLHDFVMHRMRKADSCGQDRVPAFDRHGLCACRGYSAIILQEF